MNYTKPGKTNILEINEGSRLFKLNLFAQYIGIITCL